MRGVNFSFLDKSNQPTRIISKQVCTLILLPMRARRKEMSKILVKKKKFKTSEGKLFSTKEKKDVKQEKSGNSSKHCDSSGKKLNENEASSN